MGLSFSLDEAQKTFLGKQAITAIASGLGESTEDQPLVPEHEGTLTKDLGSFVTLNLNGNLRGCIGTIVAHEPLYLNVWNMARAAAFNDPRFPPVTTREWPLLEMDISVLDQPTLCPDPEAIEIGRDGLILQFMGRSGVFLPQVPVEQHWDRRQYLDHLCVKAGVPIGSWRDPRAKLFWYQATVFGVDR